MESKVMDYLVGQVEASIDARFKHMKDRFLQQVKDLMVEQCLVHADSQQLNNLAVQNLVGEVDRVFDLDVNAAFSHLLRYFDLFLALQTEGLLRRQTKPLDKAQSIPPQVALKDVTRLDESSRKSQISASIIGQPQLVSQSKSSVGQSDFSLQESVERKRREIYDLNTEDPLQKYMVESSSKLNFEKKFLMQSRIPDKPAIRSSSASEEEDSNFYLANAQDSTYLRPLDEVSIDKTIQLPVESQQQPQEKPGITLTPGEVYTLTVVKTLKADGELLMTQIKAFLASLRPKGIIKGSVELIKMQRSPEWMLQRKLRVTASNFGVFFKRQSFDPPENLQKLVHSLLNPVNYGKIPALEYGKNTEEIAREEYCKKTGNLVEETGFWIRSDCSWLGGSPDGIVTDKATGEKGLLEIKCPYSARHMTIPEYVLEKKGAYLREVAGRYYLDKSHNYYYQIQGCLFILDLQWCDFVVRTEKDILVERITRNDQFIGSMLFRLAEFYLRFLVPSLATESYKKKPAEYKMLSKEAFESEAKHLLAAKEDSN